MSAVPQTRDETRREEALYTLREAGRRRLLLDTVVVDVAARHPRGGDVQAPVAGVRHLHRLRRPVDAK